MSKDRKEEYFVGEWRWDGYQMSNATPALRYMPCRLWIAKQGHKRRKGRSVCRHIFIARNSSSGIRELSHCRRRERSHLRPRSPLNLFTFGAASVGAGLTTFDERSVAAPRPVVRPSNLSHGATSAFRGWAPVFSPPMARRAEGGNGQSMVDAALEATLGAILGA